MIRENYELLEQQLLALTTKANSGECERQRSHYTTLCGMSKTRKDFNTDGGPMPRFVQNTLRYRSEIPRGMWWMLSKAV
jgi:hypothetical protein